MITVMENCRITAQNRQMWQEREGHGNEDDFEMEVFPTPTTRSQDDVIEPAGYDTF